MTRVALSYRRDDSAAITGRIFDRLTAHYGGDSVFRDIDNIPLGVDFREYIDKALGQTDIVLVVVGPRWFGARRGRRRIDDPADPVRVEVETALRSGMPVVPVLVEGAGMPNVEQLPDSLKELVYRNGLSIDSGRDFDQHIDRLIRNIEPILAPRAKEQAEAAQRVEEERQQQAKAARQVAEARQRDEEERQLAETARLAAEEKQRGAARQAEEERRQPEAARQAEEEKQRAEAARRAEEEEEKRQVEAARRAEEEKRQAQNEDRRALAMPYADEVLQRGMARWRSGEKPHAETARLAEEPKPRVGAARAAEAPPLGRQQNQSAPLRKPELAHSGVRRLLIFAGVFVGAGVLFAVVLTLLLSSGTRTSFPSAVTQPPSSPSIANRPARDLGYRDQETAKQIIQSIGR